MDLTRRNFLTGAALAGGALGLGALAGCAPNGGGESKGLAATGEWDHEADVVVVGGGTGQAAAIAAAAAGMSVILLEARDMVGGAMAFSGGNAWLANTAYSQENGDSYEFAKKYLDHMQMGMDNEEIVEAYLANTQAVVDVLTGNGVNLQPLPRNGQYQPNWEGADVIGRSCQVMGDNDGSDHSEAGGMRLNTSLSTACDNLGVEIMTGTRGRRLVTERDNSDAVPRVVGIVAEKGSKELRIRAAKGVILATGGFEWNPKLVEQYIRVPLKYGLSFPENIGDGLLMVQSVGADLNLMPHTFGMPCFQAHGEYAKENGQIMSMAGNAARSNPGSIIVDQNGRRFCREDSSYMSINNTFGGYNNFGDEGYTCDPAWWICDQLCYDQNGGPTGTCVSWGYPVPEIPEEDFVYKADTLKELGEMIGINADQFVKTVEEYNLYAKDGEDPLFHRGEWGTAGMPAFDLQTLETPPYYAVAINAGCCGTIGGPKLNGNAQVMHVTGEPIEGLYAMGNCAGVGGPGPSYGGEGGTIGPAFVFGIIAVNHMASKSSEA